MAEQNGELGPRAFETEPVLRTIALLASLLWWLSSKKVHVRGDYLQNMDIEHGARPPRDVVGWQPVENRTGTWWHAAFHNITAVVGAGVLALPRAMTYLTWGPGVLILFLSWAITLFTMHQMCKMHEMIPGVRFDRYHELGQQAFGPRLGLWIVVPLQLVVEVGVDIVYMVTGGESLQYFYHLTCKHNCPLEGKLQIWIVIFSSVHFVLAQLPNLNSITWVSFAAAIMSLSYSTITWAIPAHSGKCTRPLPDYHLPNKSTAGVVFGVFNALGTVAFAYSGHNVAEEIQATLPSTPQRPSKIAMWRGVLVAYAFIAACYFPVAIVGYWAYGNEVGESVVTYVTKPSWLVKIANLMVVVHMIGGYQIYAMPVYDMLETLMASNFRFSPSIKLRLITRSLYVGFTMFVAMALPFYGSLLGFFGGFAFAPTTYFLPCIIWLKIYSPSVGSVSWITNWICIILGVLLMLVSCIGGLRSLIQNAATFHPFQNTFTFPDGCIPSI